MGLGYQKLMRGLCITADEKELKISQRFSFDKFIYRPL